MKIATKRISVMILIIAMVSQMVPLAVFAESDNTVNNVLEIDNNYVLVRVKNDDGRFTIKTKEGSPLRENDSDKNLLFEEKEPETSFTTFRIEEVDGTDENGVKDYIYGNNYGFLGLDGDFTKLPENDQGNDINTSIWNIKGFEITQSIEIIDDPNNSDAGNVKIKYEVTNKGTKVYKIGPRILLDTMLGSNDGAPVMIETEEGSTEVYYEKEFKGEDLPSPSMWRTMDDTFSPSVIAYGFLDGWGNIKPDKITIGHYEGLSTTKWDYEVDRNLGFTSNLNEYGSADSAVALYWDPISVNPNETKVFETYYGIGSIAKPNEDINFTMNLYSPEKLTLNEDKDGYEEDYFKIVGEIDNKLANSNMLENVQLSLILDDGLELKKGEVPYRNISVIQKNGKYNFEFSVKASPDDEYRVLKYRIDVMTEGLEDPISFSDSILAPGSKGLPPNLQFNGIAPSTIYNEGNKVFTIKGSGYGLLGDKDRWRLKLINTVTQNEYWINQGYIIVNDNTITVKYPEDIELGEFEIYIDPISLGVKEQKIPYKITVSDDVKYRTKSYGLLGVVKTVDLNLSNEAKDFTYDIKTFESEDALKDFKNGINVVNSYNDIEELLMVIRGDITALTTDDTRTFVIDANNNPVLINGVVQYKGEEITIVEDKDGVKLTGNGVLKLVEGFTFWKWGFKTDLLNGTDYSLEAKSAEDLADLDLNNIQALIEEDIEYTYLREPGDAQKNVEIDFLGKGTVVKNIFGFLIQMENAILRDDGVSFGGQMALTFIPGMNDSSKNGTTPFEFSANIDNVLYEKDGNGKAKFKGIDTTASIGMPEDMVGGILKNGNVGMLKIDTIENVYTLEGDVSIKIIECHGLFTIMKKHDKYFLDDLELRIGIPEIHLGSPLMSLNSLGGGVNDLYGTLSGDKTAPPLKIILAAGFEMVDKSVFEGVAKLTASKLGFTIEGNVDLVPIDTKVLKHFHLTTRWAKPMYLEAGAEIDILDIVKGKANIYISSRYFEGRAEASIQAPRSVPIIGGMKFAEIGMGINTKKVWGNVGVNIWVPIWGTKRIGVGCAYYWKGGFEVTDKSNNMLNIPNSLYKETLFDEDNNPITMLVGTNITKLGDSTNSVKLASINDGFYEPTVYASLDNTVHYFNVYNQDVAIFQLDYEGDEPDMNLYRPDETEYPLVNENGEKGYIIQEDETDENKKHIYIFVPNAENGVWKLEASKSAESALLNLNQPPEFVTESGIQAELLDEDDDNNIEKIKVDWEALNSDDAYINLSLTTNKDEAGILVKSNIDASLETATFEIPDGLLNGNYYIRAEIIKGDYGYESLYSEPIELKDPYNTPKIDSNSINVELAGNGTLGVEFDQLSDNDITGYYIELFDELGNKIDNAGEYFVKHDDELHKSAVLGGQYETQEATEADLIEESDDPEIIKKIEEAKENRIVEEEPFSLDYNKTYKVGITTLVELDDISHFSDIVYSGEIYLPSPDPAEINVKIENSYNTIKENDKDIKLIKDNQVVINFVSNQDINTTVKVNEYVYETFAENKKQISIPVEDGDYVIDFISENDNKDITTETISFKVDTTEPILMIETIEKEQDQIRIKGITESDATVIINGEQVDVDSNCIFEDSISIENLMKKMISIKAEDKAGNISLFETEVLNSDVQTIEKVYINPQSRSIQNLSDYQFELIGVTSNGEELTLNNDMVKWSLLKGETLVDLSEDGLLSAYNEGEIIIKGSYYISEDYAFEDALAIEITKDNVVNNVQGVAVKPNIQEIINGESQQFELIGLDENNKEIALDKTKVTWSIINGGDLASISSNGLMKATSVGVIEIKGLYYIDEDNTYEDTLSITIKKKEIINNVKSVAIKPNIQEIINEETQQFELVGLDENNKEIALDKTKVTWSIINGRDLASISSNGLMEATSVGAIEIKGSYYIDEDNVYEDTISVDIKIEDTNDNHHSSDNDKISSGLQKILNNIIASEKNLVLIKEAKLYSNRNNILKPNSSLKIYIPAWALSKDDAILVGKVKDKDKNSYLQGLDGVKLIGDIYELQLAKSNQNIDKPIVLTFKLDKSQIENIDNIGIYYYNEKYNKWEYIEGKISENEISIEINHFSKYAVLEKDDVNINDIEGRWSEEYIKKLVSLGILNGIDREGAKYMEPKRYITRLELAAMVSRVMNLSDNDDTVPPFVDWDEIPNWGKEYVRTAYNNNWINGKTLVNGKAFAPKDYATRAEVSTIIGRLIGTENIDNCSFKDKDQIPSWAKEHVDKLVYHDIISGYNDGTFKPNKNITREEVSKILSVFIEDGFNK